MRKEIFFLAYHLHWSHAEVMDLPTQDRWVFVQMLSQQLEQEHAAIEKARKR